MTWIDIVVHVVQFTRVCTISKLPVSPCESTSFDRHRPGVMGVKCSEVIGRLWIRPTLILDSSQWGGGHTCSCNISGVK